MNSIKLAPLIGLTADPHVELESLSSLIQTYPLPNSHTQNYAPFINQINPIKKKPIVTISGALDTVAPISMKRSSTRTSRRNRRDQCSPLSINDVNDLWGVYLRQQEDFGVDTSDKQAMARRYHKLDRDQVRTLKILSGKTEPDDNAPIEIPRKSKNKVAPESVKRSDKPVNKRQKRKKMIRDELKRQLSMFTDFPGSEGFPWKAIISERGYRQLKLIGWPNNIPISKRIDDFNPSELNIFEDAIRTGTLRIIKMKDVDLYATEEDNDEDFHICY
ncbi:uncharacterized protein EV154DRAFT_602198 [Mucor mucedo]|uniref:uncharacterized protein n=1 Tax=Mucor mucedo TaxID=29922 RepID=UPI00221F1399|nr:uncharacterized protein EV154DRAFT_602198 [Mucor mucedo]KAI7891696.1 hypothetical protein EV154DRAFT_602198 [Mucor mucedo]